MRPNLFYYLLLAILTLTDAWLLAHPNLIGRFGIFFYDYSMLETLPKAMLTVVGTVLVALLLAGALVRFTRRPLSVLLTGLLLAICLYAIVDTYLKFNSGTYRLTGAGFRTGAILLPIILALVFGRATAEAVRKKY